MALVINDRKNHPSDISVQVDMLELMNKVLDHGAPKLSGLAILESAWNLRDMPLYRKAIRHWTAGGHIPNDFPKLLATLVNQSPAAQVVNWSEWSETTRSLHFFSFSFIKCSFADIDISSIVSVTS